MAGLFVLKRAASFAIIKEMEREVPCVQMQTLLPDCSVRKLQPVNADIEKIYAMASQNMLFYQYHPPFVPGRAFWTICPHCRRAKRWQTNFILAFLMAQRWLQ